MLLSEELIKNLVCPKTGLPMFYDSLQDMLVNQDKSYGYCIRDGIPILLCSMAVRLSDTAVSG